MTTPTFFPGHISLLDKAEISASPENANAIAATVHADVAIIKTQPFPMWRSLIASRYASDPIVTLLLARIEENHNAKNSTWTTHFS